MARGSYQECRNLRCCHSIPRVKLAVEIEDMSVPYIHVCTYVCTMYTTTYSTCIVHTYIHVLSGE